MGRVLYGVPGAEAACAERALRAVSDTARHWQVSEQINPDIEAAKEVAENMRSSGLQVQFYDSEHELDFGGVEQLTRARRAADAVVSAAE